MKKEKDILAIDDEQVVVNAIVKILGNENFSVDTSTNSSEALVKINSNKYNLIICDIMMPDADGFEILNQVQKSAASTPIIMSSGYSTIENAVRSLYEGAVDFVPKPFTADELISSVKRALKYSDLINLNSEFENQKNLFFVSCPSKYRRLGYSTWSFTERDGTAIIGMTDIFIKSLEQIEEIIFPDGIEEVVQANSCLQIKTSDGLLHYVLSPISGRIVEKNFELINHKEILEKDPYFKGWVYRIIPTDYEYESKNLIPCSSDRC